MCDACSDPGARHQAKTYVFLVIGVVAVVLILVGAKALGRERHHFAADCRKVTSLAASYGARLAHDRRSGGPLLLHDTRLFVEQAQQADLASCPNLPGVARSASTLLVRTCSPCTIELGRLRRRGS